MKSFVKTLATVSLWLIPVNLPSQTFAPKLSPQDRLTAARALYYTPTTAGLKSFGCKASFDWKDLLQTVRGKPVEANDLLLVYLNSTNLSVSDDLRGEGHLDWANTSVPDPTVDGSATKMQHGMKQIFDGFFKSWNAYLNGTMIPIPDKTIQLTPADGGLQLHAPSESMTVDEDFDKNMLLTKAHVSTPQMDVVATPIFINTPDGRLISEIHNEVKMPITSPPVYADFFVTYRDLNGYRIPETIRFDEKNVAVLEFKLTDCITSPTRQKPVR
ncbi:MAG TPA: hypothetical protein VGU46_05090 [Acidobacteriaceae bacterium]|nr:hypothetical protein [Acidobacteriaceae bacterium]